MLSRGSAVWRKPEGERHRALRQGDGQERIAARILAHYPQALGHAENGFSGRCGRGLRPRRPPSGAKEKGPGSLGSGAPLGAETPSASATSCPPTGLPRSTFGDGRLNCRVRNGTG